MYFGRLMNKVFISSFLAIFSLIVPNKAPMKLGRCYMDAKSTSRFILKRE